MSELSRLLAGEGGRYAPDAEHWPWLRLGAITALGGLVFGAAMGSFSLCGEQMLYSALKVPLFQASVTLISLPSLFALHLALGLGRDFPAALRGIAAAQATLAVTLAALAPLCLFVYASSASYRLAIVADGGFFALGSVAGQMTLLRHDRKLLADPRHLLVRAAWGAIFVFVGIQAAWVLRPFVGAPGLAPSFLRAELWTNAYVVVARAVAELLSGKA